MTTYQELLQARIAVSRHNRYDAHPVPFEEVLLRATADELYRALVTLRERPDAYRLSGHRQDRIRARLSELGVVTP